MDLATHAFAERGVDQPMPGQRQFAAEGFGDHGGLEVHAVGAGYRRGGAGQAFFDQFADGVCVQFDEPPGRVGSSAGTGRAAYAAGAGVFAGDARKMAAIA